MRSHTPPMLRLACILLPAFAFLTSLAESGEARQNIRQSFFLAYPAAVGSRLDNLPSIQAHCGVCHYQFTGAGPKNPYGTALGNVLGQYPNNDQGRIQAMRSIENLDSETDGYSTLIEITDTVNFANTPTFPGLKAGNVGQVSGVDVNDILAYLVPEVGGDTQAPSVTVLSPNGSEIWGGGTIHSVTWTATDNVGVVAVDVFYREGASEPWTQIAKGLENTGSFVWHVHNTPTTGSRVRIVARDGVANQGEDQSNANFTILAQTGSIAPTTLRDFKQPGSQPFDAGAFQDRTACADCHGGYDPAVEPDFNFRGNMMGQAARDPLFYACLAVAEQDAASSGDICLRCHSPMGWLSGRSNPTSGIALNGVDRDGVACDYCHRAVDPIYRPGESPAVDQTVLAALDEVPAHYLNGMYVVDPEVRRRGPFPDPVAPHPFLESPFHRSSRICGTCHEVSNPAFERTGDYDYAPGPFDQPAASVNSTDLFPVERTYSEWVHSAYPNGVYAPEFAGNKPDGIVSTCQDCHMRDVRGPGCDDPNAPIREDLPHHDMMGGNSWIPTILDQLYPNEVDAAALAAGAARAISMLQKAADVELSVSEAGGELEASATVTNRTGHKLPTGYPEGRRMWLHLAAYDAADEIVYESGAYDGETGVLTHDEDLAIYEAELGISPGLGGVLGLSPGISFHFVLNDSIYKDTRIPPQGFTNAAYLTFGGTPVDPHHEGPGPRYADGQNWDEPSYSLPPTTRTVIATLYYQITSKEYVEFLRDENHTNGSGQLLHDLWTNNGRAAPVAMAADTAFVVPSDAADGGGIRRFSFAAGPNPFRQTLDLRMEIPGMETARIDIFEVGGRLVRTFDLGRVSGSLGFVWDGRDGHGNEVGSGIYWLRAKAGGHEMTRRVIRMR